MVLKRACSGGFLTRIDRGRFEHIADDERRVWMEDSERMSGGLYSEGYGGLWSRLTDGPERGLFELAIEDLVWKRCFCSCARRL